MLLGSIASESLTQGFDVGFGHGDGPVYAEQVEPATGGVPVHVGDEMRIHKESPVAVKKK